MLVNVLSGVNIHGTEYVVHDQGFGTRVDSPCKRDTQANITRAYLSCMKGSPRRIFSLTVAFCSHGDCDTNARADSVIQDSKSGKGASFSRETETGA